MPASYLFQLVQLAEQGVWEFEPEEFTTDWDGEAYNTVSGQSSNNSLRITDAFMKAVIDDGWWELDQPHRRQGAAEGEARDIWDKIALAAWLCADPGLQFHTTINDWHTCPKDGEIRASNPCSEYMFLDDTACNLASLNLLAFYDRATGEFRVDDLRHAIRLWTIVLEISVLMAQFPSQAIARKSYDYRTLGLGLRQPRHAAHGDGHPLRQRRGPGHRRGARGHPHRRGVRRLRRDGRRARARSRASPPTATTCCA